MKVNGQALRGDVTNVSLDNDNDSVEILFTVDQTEYRLKLETFQD